LKDKGLSLRGSTLYCTTLPCHECARLIIGSGIRRVYFIEPYEKSRVSELYHTEIEFGPGSGRRTGDKVDFLPYVGVSPNRFNELFAWVDRKADDVPSADGRRQGRQLRGEIVDWDATARTGKVRRTIITNDALYVRARLDDLVEHEEQVVRDYDVAYGRAVHLRERGPA